MTTSCITMRYARNMLLFVDTVTREDEKRARGRFARPPFRCSFGTVEDVSSTGMRVRMKGGPRVKPGQIICLTLLNEPERGLVKVEVVWLKRNGFRRRSMGLKFIDISDEAHRVIMRSIGQAVGSMSRHTGRASDVA